MVAKINKQAKIEFCKNLDPRKLDSEKAFWQTFKPLLSNKCSNPTRKITLIDEGVLLSKDEEVSECFNIYFKNITDTFKIARPSCVTLHGQLEHPVHAAILQYSKYPSIIRSKERTNDANKLVFQTFEYSEVWDEINHLNMRKKTSGDIPSHISKMTSDFPFNQVTNIANSMVQSCIFPDPLKLADVLPVYRDGTSTAKSNYRSISVLSAFSKVFHRLLKKQMAPFMEPKLEILFVDLEIDIVLNMLYLKSLRQSVCISTNQAYVVWY